MVQAHRSARSAPTPEENRLFFKLLNRPLLIATCALLLLHGGLLAASIPNYRVTIDSAYHVSMARDYGEHWLVPWDYINFGPRGRPNLQGPLLHAAIGGLGRLLGGDGNDYIVANAILAVIQWAAAMATVAFFSFSLGGELAMLIAVALLSGAGFAGASFAIGIPSGWLFVFTPWAIWFFLEGRIAAAAVLTVLAIYSHIGGYLTAPLGIAIAALLTRHWKQLLRCGLLAAALTLPYTIHIIRYVGWFSGVKSHSALLFDPMLDVLAIVAAVSLCRNPREHPFMIAWLIAPIAWVFQDTGRFLLQWPLGGSVAAGWLVAKQLRLVELPRRLTYALCIAALATLLPFGLPSLAGEVAWLAGNQYPLAVDWQRTQVTARSIQRAGLTSTLIADYSPTLCPGLAVYADLGCEKGDWIEVQPTRDPADNISAANKTYVIPLPATDPMLVSLSSLGRLIVHTGSVPSESTIVSLRTPQSIADAAVLVSATIRTEAEWLGRYAINNALSLTDFWRVSSPSGRAQFIQTLAIQRTHAGRIELACLLYAWALEENDPQDARTMRQIALRLGVIASYLSDDYALDFLSQGRFAELKGQFLELATRSNRLAFYPIPGPELIANFKSLSHTVMPTRDDLFGGRPSGEWLP